MLAINQIQEMYTKSEKMYTYIQLNGGDTAEEMQKTPPIFEKRAEDRRKMGGKKAEETNIVYNSIEENSIE